MKGPTYSDGTFLDSKLTPCGQCGSHAFTRLRNQDTGTTRTVCLTCVKQRPNETPIATVSMKTGKVKER